METRNEETGEMEVIPDKGLYVEKLGPHTFSVLTNKGRYIQHYHKVLAFSARAGRYVTLDKNQWENMPRGAMMHVAIFLRCSIPELRRRVKCGQYKLGELN